MVHELFNNGLFPPHFNKWRPVYVQIEKPLQKHGGRLEHNETYCGSCFGAEQVYLRVYILNTGDIKHSEYNVYLCILSFDAIRQNIWF